MLILNGSNISSIIEFFYILKNELNELKSDNNILNDNQKKIAKIENNISQCMGKILSGKASDVLASNFYVIVNEIEQLLFAERERQNNSYEFLLQKEDKLLEKMDDIISKIYSIDVLNKSIKVDFNIDKRLLDLKNNTKFIEEYKNYLNILEYLVNLVEKYSDGYLQLLELLLTYKYKSEIPFNKKQEVFELLKITAFDRKLDKLHSCVFSDEMILEYNSDLTIEYLYLYENSFMEKCSYVGVELIPLYDYLKNNLYDYKSSFESIKAELIQYFKKYKYLLENKRNLISDKIDKLYNEIYESLPKCYLYSDIPDVDDFIQEIELTEKLPSYMCFDNKEYSQLLVELIIRKSQVGINGINIYSLLDDLKKNFCELFDSEEYYNIYLYYSTDKIYQVIEFKKYINKIFEQAKMITIRDYLARIEKEIPFSILQEYNKKTTESIDLAERHYNDLESAVHVINRRYRYFDEENRRLYIDILGDFYEVKNAYEQYEKYKNSLELSTNKKLSENRKAIYDFINKYEINIILKDALIDELIPDNPGLNEDLKKKLRKNKE